MTWRDLRHRYFRYVYVRCLLGWHRWIPGKAYNVLTGYIRTYECCARCDVERGS